MLRAAIGFDPKRNRRMFFLPIAARIDVGVVAILGVDAELVESPQQRRKPEERQARGESGGNKQVRARIAEVGPWTAFPSAADRC